MGDCGLRIFSQRLLTSSPTVAEWGARPSRLPFSASRRKLVSQTEWFNQWFGGDTRTGTRDARAPAHPTDIPAGCLHQKLALIRPSSPSSVAGLLRRTGVAILRRVDEIRG